MEFEPFGEEQLDPVGDPDESVVPDRVVGVFAGWLQCSLRTGPAWRFRQVKSLSFRV